MSDKLNLHQRINEVRKGNAYIKKDKRVEGMYLAVSHDQVTAELRDDLIQQGVLVVPSVVPGTAKTVDTGKKAGSKQNPIIRFEAEYAISYVNVDDPKDREVMVLPAHAEDHGDKAPGKACSYAVKTSLLKMFNIETGENDEARVEAHGASGMEEKAIADWKAKCDAVSTAAEGETVWKDIVRACAAANDEQAVTTLRAYLSAAMTRKKIKSGQRRTNGGENARTAAH